MRNPHILVQDYCSHWYLIPLDAHTRFEEALELSDEYPEHLERFVGKQINPFNLRLLDWTEA